MPQAVIDAIYGEYDAMSRMDWDEMFSGAHEDFEFRPPDRGLNAGVERGRDNAREAIVQFFSPFEEIQIEPQEIHERGDLIAVYVTMRTRPHGSTAMIEIRVGHLWEMRDGRPASLEIFPEREQALAAAERGGDQL